MKERFMNLATCLIAMSLSGCSGENGAKNQETAEPASVVKQQLANTVFTNGNIYTVNAAQPKAQAVALKDGEIIFVGDDSQVQHYIGDNTQVINLGGKMMMPGIHDVHIHPLESGSDATHFALNEAETDVEYYIDDIIDAAAQNPQAQWLIGYGHSIEALLDAQRNPRDILDDAVPDRPVIIMEQTSHSMWVNSKALSLANITGSSQDPIGGVISRDSFNRPDGILYDNAGNIVMDIAMQAQNNAAEKDYLGFVEYTQGELNKHGITSISDARTYWQRDHLSTWQKIADNRELTMRVSLGLWAYPEANDSVQIAKLLEMYQANTDSLLKVNQIKFYMDGILVNTTAAMHAPYEFDLLGLHENKGVNYFTPQRLEKYLKALEPTGFDFNIHAIGDRGITEALDAIENASNGKGRHRLTHLEVMDPKDYARFARLNVIADAQVAGDFTKAEHWRENIDYIGAERSDNIIPIGSLLDNNARLTLSSDWNVSTFNPFVGIAHAITRTPQEIPLADAIQAYTINGAYAMRQDDITGSIEVGKRGDLIVLDRDLFTSSAAQIKATRVEMTWLDGELIYKR
ncbi:amidohydrolase [Thalassomonas haliotis]|uniref:Amidohydrolase n=1 Tax=Thalassomonas haliotis TaxID=485448 RepID=A0ABY7V9W2_9GAMM|nr:amidohydrolase [Thalassomonas haliotis]WDE10147.1 amidohydrolase [Thalassomonas haliotis]